MGVVGSVWNFKLDRAGSCLVFIQICEKCVTM